MKQHLIIQSMVDADKIPYDIREQNMNHGEDYCVLEFYLDRLEEIQPLIREALLRIEPPVTPNKIKEALSRINSRVIVERDPNDPNRLIILSMPDPMEDKP